MTGLRPAPLRRLAASVTLLQLLGLATPATLGAYEVATHRDLSRRAAERSTVHRALVEMLDLLEGLATRADHRTLLDWIGEGAVREDAWYDGVLLRFLRHFHDPTRPWDDAGLLLAHGRMPSSIRWSQDPEQPWSWPAVREDYHRALTAGTEAARRTALARTFRGLGQLVHLVQDLASPAHTRDDPHVGYNYEKFVADEQRGTSGAYARWVSAAPPTPPDGAWATLAPDPLAPLPLARLFDTDRYTGHAAALTIEPLIGLAEYTNANFFSEDRRFPPGPPAPGYPFPARTSVDVADYAVTLANGARVQRRYYRKVRDGDTGYRLATVGFLRDYALAHRLDLTRVDHTGALDGAVYDDYAARLLPRALTYSTALLDHFFRGRLELEFTPDPTDRTRTLLTVRNGSDEPLGVGGKVALYTTDEVTRGRTPVIAATLEEPVPPRETAARFSVDAGLEASDLVAVYRGPLGREPDAVVGRIRPAAQVEQIFRGASDWMLRTPEGIFPLGVGLGPGRVRWGDRDNTFLTETFVVVDGRTDHIFQAYEIQRPEGARTVPRRPDGRVDVRPLGGPVRLGGEPIDLGTAVTYERSTEYSQQLVLLEGAGSRTLVFGPTLYAFSATFPLALTLATPLDTIYFWSLLDVHLDRRGEVIGLVRVDLSGPDSVQAPLHRHEPGTDRLVVDPDGPIISFRSPPTDVMLFVVNLTRRTVVAKSCEDRVRITFRTRTQEAVLERRNELTGTYSPVLTRGASPLPSLAEYEVRQEVLAVEHPGLFRAELATQGFIEPDIVIKPSAVQLDIGDPDYSVTERIVFSDLGAGFLLPDDIRRADGRDEGYVILARGGPVRWLVSWWPLAAAAQRGAALATPAAGLITLEDANRVASVVRVASTVPQRVRQAHLVTPTGTFVFPESFLATFDLLEPDLLYGRADLRFHRLTAGLEPLPGPRPLAPGGPTTGEYHVIGRR